MLLLGLLFLSFFLSLLFRLLFGLIHPSIGLSQKTLQCLDLSRVDASTASDHAQGCLGRLFLLLLVGYPHRFRVEQLKTLLVGFDLALEKFALSSDVLILFLDELGRVAWQPGFIGGNQLFFGLELLERACLDACKFLFLLLDLNFNFLGLGWDRKCFLLFG